MKKLLLCLLLFSGVAHADEASLGFGVGAFGDAKYSTGQVKAGEASYRSFLIDGIYWQNKVGYWGEGSPDPSRKSSMFGSTGFGLEVDLRPLEIRAGYGLAFISTPDSQLGGRFPQFNGDLYVGLRDKKGDGIGIDYMHISSAGLVTPNQGRDFFILQLSQKW